MNPYDIVALFCVRDLETTKTSFDRGLDKDVVHIYTMEYYSAIRNDEVPPLAVTWIDFETIMLREISQTEESESHMISPKSYVGYKTESNK